ncbi:MAG TPA: GAF and ANTAR domain-containing protein [Actinophytocola sp.]|jgi:hypothetical protein|uniref:GAF and ANTAR domain-containing protein n=1 Tax=Actinophytocola sp. TaxID=1872138 RepID=UPI002DFF1931|nr:GAF and ANTAR domain-containing protein [Actinophytocola sp.]
MGDTDRRGWDAMADLAARFVAEADLACTLAWLADQCAELLGGTAAGVMVIDAQGALDVAAASSGPARELQELEKRHFEGPARDSFHAGRRIDCPDLAEADDRWPRFAPVAQRHGNAALHAFPMALPGRTIGAMTVFLADPGALPGEALETGQTLANLAAIGVGSYRARQNEILAAQLQAALHSRVLIEQAKGLLAERLGIPLDDAFALMRQHARSHGRKLGDIASAVLDGRLILAGEPTE